MSKTRVYEYAKKHNVSSKDIIGKLKEMKLEVSNHMTAMEPDTVRRLDAIYNKSEEKQQTTTTQKQSGSQQRPAQSQQNSGQRQGQGQQRSAQGQQQRPG
ncbi:translation initiation factor IF-2 N-terminal domain-containing protein, partial [Mesobacillus zeae]